VVVAVRTGVSFGEVGRWGRCHPGDCHQDSEIRSGEVRNNNSAA